MPFLGMDWRTPGQYWVKDERGDWLKMEMVRRKVLNKLHEETLCRNNYYTDPSVRRPQTYIIFRENKVLMPLGEALIRLEMADAVKDTRKFQYISALVGHLLRHNMTTLSGCAQKTLMNILQCIVHKSVSNNVDNKLIKNLLNDLQETLVAGRYDHVGCGALWQDHWKELERMKMSVAEFDRKLMNNERSDSDEETSDSLKLNDLPSEILHLILLRLTDHTDLSSAFNSFYTPLEPQNPLKSTQITKNQASQNIKNQPLQTRLCQNHIQNHAQPQSENSEEQEIYFKKLCLYHFPDRNTWFQLLRKKDEESFKGWTWAMLYQKLTKRFQMPTDYPDPIMLCKHCSALFWKLEGHPCALSRQQSSSRPIPPESFANLFAL